MSQSSSSEHQSQLSMGSAKSQILRPACRSQCRINQTLHKIDPTLTQGIQNGRLAQEQFNRILRLNNIYNLLLFVNFILMFAYYQLDIRRSQFSGNLLFFSFTSHCLSSILVLIQVLLTIMIRYEQFSLAHSHKISLSYIRTIGSLAIFALLHPFPGMNSATFTSHYYTSDGSDFQFAFKTNYLLMLLGILCKLICLFPTLMFNNSYLQPRSKRICRIYSVNEQPLLFAIKCLFKDMPMLIFSIIFIMGVLFFSFALKVSQSSIDSNNYRNYFNCIWFVLISISTVGYGDIYPSTSLGYFFTVLCTLWGTVMTSSILVILINTLSLNTKEREALQLYKKIQMTLELKSVSGQYLRLALWRVWLNYRDNENVKQGFAEKKLRLRFSRFRNKLRREGGGINVQQQMQKNFDNAKINIDYLLQNNNLFLSFISDHMFLDGATDFIRTAKTIPFETLNSIQESMHSSMPVNSVIASQPLVKRSNSLKVEADQLHLINPLSAKKLMDGQKEIEYG